MNSKFKNPPTTEAVIKATDRIRMLIELLHEEAANLHPFAEVAAEVKLFANGAEVFCMSSRFEDDLEAPPDDEFSPSNQFDS